MSPIKFGTDGWRAIIDQDFTPQNITKVIQAFCDLYANDKNKLVFVGHDRRLKSPESAKLVAQVLAHNGFDVRLAKSFCPTPCVSWLVKNNHGLAGVMVTASHNPPAWNGIKFKESYGGAASPEYTDRIEKQIELNGDKKITCRSFDDLLRDKRIEYLDPDATYVTYLREFINVVAIRRAGFKIAVDPLFGAGTNYIAKVLQIPITEIHTEADTNFGGLNPEPIDKNLAELMNLIKRDKLTVGLATDGDADRIGAVDEKGNYVNSHQIFALLLKHHVEYRKLRGAVVKSVSATQWIDKLCTKYGLEIIETPIGFKHISKELQARDALMGGEESGGISLREHVHERDGVLNGLMLLEMMALHGKTLGELLEDLYKEHGRFCFERVDYHIDRARIDSADTKIRRKDLREVLGVAVKSYNTLDGIKVLFADDSWLLVRASGTEPLLRTYAEAHSLERVQGLLKFAGEYLQLS